MYLNKGILVKSMIEPDFFIGDNAGVVLIGEFPLVFDLLLELEDGLWIKLSKNYIVSVW